MKEQITINAFKLESIDRLSVEEKKDGILKLNKIYTYRKISTMLNVPVTTLYQWANGQTVGGKDRSIEKLKKELNDKPGHDDVLYSGRRLKGMIDTIKEYTPKSTMSKNLLLQLSVVALDASRRWKG